MKSNIKRGIQAFAAGGIIVLALMLQHLMPSRICGKIFASCAIILITVLLVIIVRIAKF
jgi:hypothetical protein